MNVKDLEGNDKVIIEELPRHLLRETQENHEQMNDKFVS
jgi:hypothetical protein